VSTQDLALNYVTERAVMPSMAFDAGFYTVESAKTLSETFHARPALVLPYFNEHGLPVNFERVRYFEPPMGGGVKKKPIRYQQPTGTAPEIYLPRVQGLNWAQVMADVTIPIAITEGEVKSLSATINSGVPFIGLGGVFMWADNKLPIKMFERFNFERREVFIVFDSDIDTNAQVQLAEARLSSYLLKRRAKVKRARLPTGSDGAKMGADDFIAAFGPEAFQIALKATPNLSDMEMRILEMNDKICYLEEEEKLMPLDGGAPFSKASFTDGSIYSTLKAAIPKGEGVMMKSVAREWLSNPLARRYTNTIFKPGSEEIVRTTEGIYLNSWQEQPCEPGDVTHFLDLTQYLFQETLGDDWRFPIKLMAFKAQNQTVKVPLAIMLIGEQGSGKSLWSKLVMSAFGQYGKSKSGRDLDQNWNGFIEKALVATIDDVSARQMRQNIETLRNWISESKVERIEKYLKNREVDNYCLFIFTTNHRDAGAFAHDDRRFLVVGAPRREFGKDHYQPVWDWIGRGKSGANIYDFLLAYDLEGWTPPITAPMTSEKEMAHEESLSEFAKLARDMRESDHHIVNRWLQTAEQWALNVIGSLGHPETAKANEIIHAINQFPIRPWYTSQELTNMFPHMIQDLHNRTKRWNHAAIEGKVSQELRNEGIYFLKNDDDARGFLWKGDRKQFLVVCPSAGYAKSMKQHEFDNYMATFGNYVPSFGKVA
jgi:hypothetical protein